MAGKVLSRIGAGFKWCVLAPFRPFMAMWRDRRMAIPAILSALLLVLSFQPFVIYPLTFICLVPLLFVVTRVSARKAFVWGWLTGTLIIFFGFHFIYTLLIVFGALPWFAAGPIHVLFSAYQGIEFAFFGALTAALLKTKKLPPLLVVPAVYVAVEFVCREFFIFPWYIGNAPYPLIPFIQAADLGGGLLLSWIVVLINTALFLLLATWLERRKGGDRPYPKISLAIAAAVAGLTLIYGFWRTADVDDLMAEQPSIRIGLVEADLGIGLKGHTVLENLRLHQQYSIELAARGADLIVWPETAVNTNYYPVSTEQSDDLEVLRESTRVTQGVLTRDATFIMPSEADFVLDPTEDRTNGTTPADWLALQRGFDTPLLFGVLTERAVTESERTRMPPHPWHPPRAAYNSAILVDSDGRIRGTYDKNVLLAFGEFVPFSEFLWGTFDFNFYEVIPTAGQVFHGEGARVIGMPFTTDDGVEIDVRIGGMVCYEDIIAEYGLMLAEQRPNMFINVINDGWFGESSAAYHHMAFSVLRAVEHRIPLVRATNTGVSSFIDPVGRILSHTEVTGAETLLEDVPVMPPPTTIYSRIGDVVGWLAWAVICGSIVVLRRRRPTESAA